jgi:tRNA(Ile)-lysidine synthase
MRILRGSGPGGLRAMPSRRPFFDSPSGPVLLLRPLLAFSRADVEAYLNGLGIPWRDDATNGDERFLRNRIRLSLTPLLNEKFPGWRRGLAALGETQALAADFIEGEARRLGWDRAGTRRAAGGSGRELRCPADCFWAQPPILREEALFQGIGLFAGPGRTPALKRRNLRRFAAGELGTLDLGFCIIARKEEPPPGFIVICRRKPEGEAGFSLLIKGPGLYNLVYGADRRRDREKPVVLRVCGGEPSSRETGERRGFFATLPLVIRPARPGDVIPPGADPGRGVVYVAQDARGLVALIAPCPGGAALRVRRELQPGGGLFFCDIGGIDAQQSKR